MKKIAVVAMEKEYARILCGKISEYLSQYADFYYYSLKEVEDMEFIPAEFVVITTFTIFQGVKRRLKNGGELIVVNVTLNKNGLEQLHELPKGTRALLVNFDYRSCVQSITNLYGAGFNYLELIPYHGVEDYDHSIKLAITPNESRLVPEGIKRIIDIGESDVDFDGLYHISEALGVSEAFAANEAVLAKKSGIFSNFGIERVLGENENLIERVNTLLKLIRQGIILTDVVGTIHTFNEKAEQLLQSRSQLLTGFNVADILPELCTDRSGRRTEKDVWLMERKEELLSVNGANLIASVTSIKTDGSAHGFIVTLDNFEEIEEKQHGMRAKLSKADHVAHYHFSDIKGHSEAILESVVTAKRMAKSHASVLISGETGTGKEVFAQSIHNESSRARYNFVAVNCAAIPENLLESEMFGYEEGSFTGARKGGKIGYFELAHKGTIFLDEIAEMPLLLQSKLLRVIEEREIIKIGSQEVVSVDLRIIAATNRNLYRMVEAGTFREDLYYRVNVLPLRIPSLRERIEDLEELIFHFMRQHGHLLHFTEDARAALKAYPWWGNIRELRNGVEYMISLDKDEIGTGDLPPFEGMKEAISIRYTEKENADSRRAGMATSNPECAEMRAVDSGTAGMAASDPGGPEMVTTNPGSAETTIFHPGNAGNAGHSLESGKWESGMELIRRFILLEGKKIDLYSFLLEELEMAYERRERPGRKWLFDRAKERQFFYTESEIRKALSRLNECGFLYTAGGRSGSVLTGEGRQLRREVDGWLRSTHLK